MLDHALETSASKTGCGRRSATTASSPRSRTGDTEPMPMAAYDQRPSASDPAVTAPPNRPDGPASKNTGSQKCGAREGHAVYPVSRTGTGGALSNGAAGGTAGRAAPLRIGARMRVQPPDRKEVEATCPPGSTAGERAPSGSAVMARTAAESLQRYTCGSPDASDTKRSVSPHQVRPDTSDDPSLRMDTESGAAQGQRTSCQCPLR